MDDLLGRARAWAAQDPDPLTRDALTRLVADAAAGGSLDALADAFSQRLAFGTAGLRGAVGPGPNRMNLVTVMQAAAGLAAYLIERGGGAVVIGYDARHRSEDFARACAQVLTGAGLSAMVLPHPTPTPVLAYAIRPLGCAAGVMITASHNPPQDNGMKVYLADGVQITSPTDAEISAEIDRVASGPVADIAVGSEWETLDDTIIDRYVDHVAGLAAAPPPHPVPIVYTPMHGVGGEVLEAVLERAGYPDPLRVEAQFEPDPDFPTVAFPNPEEPGAMDLALDTARVRGAELVIANDPDADRCAVGVPSGAGWRMLTGDEVGSLLGWWLIERGVTVGVYAESIVSSSMLHGIATSAGLAYQETLTGFKWIGRIPALAFGYEEALGYCVDPRVVSDKDGISAALLIVEMASALKAKGRTLLDALADLERAHGVHATSQVSIRVTDLGRIATIMAHLRGAPPDAIGGQTVLRMDDLLAPTDALPPTDGLRFIVEGGIRIIIRPSGTEPKLKCYLQVVVPVEHGDLDAAHAVAEERMSQMRTAVAAWFA